jgi:hypothetical protein
MDSLTVSCARRALLLISILVAVALPGAASAAGSYGTPPSLPPVEPAAKPSTPWMTPQAVELVVNGGFEGGGAGWFVLDQPGGNGAWFPLAGTVAPISGFSILGPPEGSIQAVADQGGPGSHILYQDVTIPSGATATLNLLLWYANTAADFFNPATLDYMVTPNQQFRIDIMSPAAPLDDMGAGILLNVYATLPGDPLSIGYTPVTANLDAFAGQTVRLRFAEVDNQFFFTVGVDAVSVQAEPIVPATATTWGGLKGRYR